MTCDLHRRAAAALALFGLTGCAAIPPRPFAPLTSPPEAASEAAFETAFTACVQTVTAGTDYETPKANVAGAVVGTTVAVAGTATLGAGVALASLMSAGAGISTAAGAVVILVPAALGYGAYHGVGVISRNGKERGLEKSLTECMAAKNYKITGWRLVKPEETAAVSTPVLKKKPKS